MNRARTRSPSHSIFHSTPGGQPAPSMNLAREPTGAGDSFTGIPYFSTELAVPVPWYKPMNIADLISRLDQIQSIPNEQFLAGLEERKKSEMEFHNLRRDHTASKQLDQDTYEKLYGNRKYYIGTQDSRAYVNEWMTRNVLEKVFLDYCCGDGGSAIRAAKAGASLSIGIDISDVSIGNAKGRQRKRYRYEDLMTPYDKLKSLPNANQYLKQGMSWQYLDDLAGEMSDNEAAKQMNKARERLFHTLNRQTGVA